MYFPSISIVLTFITAPFLVLASPAIPVPLVPAVAPPAGVKLYNATAGYNAAHGLPYDKNLHGPLSQRDLQARQAFTGDATYYHAGLGACGGTNGDWEYVVALNAPQWNNGANCYRGITVQAYGKQFNAAIVDLCPGCGYGSLDLTPSLFQAFTSLDVGRFGVTWCK
ncbi:riboflavin-aldehyde forming enzyme, putative [Rhizoctonia solani AG-3 Rhs1AP]|uniref:Riboflavin-aldehyde forming enzyme, putative n=1 Tax=Rhizoctonia solani AG-3 Rhs1AP TaxID=1086054 RepID=X8J2J5_9AGAM|nr:riboflavin-aldehyde forming enzyme, putative [Rhizoctonia solani AG-3 Rhs1AP]